MPPNISLAMFVLGGVLLLLALSSGGFKIFGAEMSGVTGRWSRLVAGLLGLGLVAAATILELMPPDERPVAAPVGGAGPKDVAVASGNGTPGNTPAPINPALTTAQPVYVKCTSQGQSCDGTTEITGPFPDSLTIRAAAGCSSVKYTVTFLRRGDGFALEEISAITTRVLGPSEAQTLRVASGASVARISAEGVEGGCNTGRLASWGVIATRGGE